MSDYIWALLPPWIGWTVSALAWAVLGWVSQGSLASWMFFALAGVCCILAVVSYLKRRAALSRRRKSKAAQTHTKE